MARRRLTDEEVKKISNKEWRRTPIFTSDERVAYKAKNLTGPKTPEGKAKILKNLRVGSNPGGPRTHGGHIMRLLDEDEQELYQELKEKYMKDYGQDINSSADEAILELVLIDQVRLYRVMRAQFDNPSMDIDRPLNDISTRLNKNLESLGALRKQRLKQDDKLTAISIASIAQQFAREINGGGLQAQLDAQAEEEKNFLAKKKEREAKMYDAEYEVVDENEPTDE